MLDRLVHSFNLAISLRSCDRREYLLDLEVIAELFEFIAVELCSIVGYNGVGDSIPTDDVLVDELFDLCGRDGRKRFLLQYISEASFDEGRRPAGCSLCGVPG